MKKELNGLLLGSALVSSLGFTMTNTYAATNLSTEITISTKTGTVITNALNLRSGPSTSYSSIGKVTSGYTFEILSESNGWYKLTHNNKTAYVSANINYIRTSSTSTSKVLATGTTTATLNVRGGASTSYNKLGSITSGSKVEIVKQENSSWYKIKYKNAYAYISSQYVSLSSSGTNTGNTPSTDNSNNSSVISTGVTTDALNVRSGSSTSYSIIGKLAKGAKVNIVEKNSNGWYKIKYGTNYGYVSGQYISSNSSSATPEDNTSSTVISTGVTTDALNVRSGSSTSYSIVGKLTKGSKVNIVEKIANGWYKIQYNSGYGYVSGQYISSSSTSPNPDNNTPNSSSTKAGKITATVNVRSGSGSSYGLLGVLGKGSKIDIVERTSNGWIKIKYGNTYGYVSSDYVSASLDRFLFVGDSYTYLLTNTIKSNASNTTIRAKSGCVPSYWLNNFGQMPAASSVDGISVLLGVNGMNASAYNSTVSNMKTLINNLINKYPGKTIYVQRVFPLASNFSSATLNRIKNYNNEIKNYCAYKTNVKFIDATSGLVTDDGYLKYPDSEGIHLVPSKYQSFYNNINKAILNTY